LGGSTLLSDYWALTKPEVNFLILITTCVGFYLASAGDGRPFSFARLFNNLLGTLLVASGTGALNHYIERKFDAQMRRTARRPAAAGRLHPTDVLLFGIALAVAGSVYLAVAVNALASELAILTVLTYLFVYTPLKRETPLCVVVGAFPGAMPPLIGWAAASGRLNIEAGMLYSMLFLWQFPHFMAIAWMYREDYDRRLSGSAQGQRESSFCDFGNSVAAASSGRYQRHAISVTALGNVSLCSGSSGNRINLLRMEICVGAF
jgi:heme o synthase